MNWNPIFIFCIVVGLGIMGAGYYFEKRSQSMENWPVAYGKILSSEIIQRSSRSGKSGQNLRSTSKTTMETLPRVRYEYLVANKKYTGETNTLALGPIQLSELGKILKEKFPAGGPIKIFYNPENPPDSALEKESGMHFVFYILGGIWLSVWTIAFIISSIVKHYR
jgi:hypothetical protein